VLYKFTLYLLTLTVSCLHSVYCAVIGCWSRLSWLPGCDDRD